MKILSSYCLQYRNIVHKDLKLLPQILSNKDKLHSLSLLRSIGGLSSINVKNNNNGKNTTGFQNASESRSRSTHGSAVLTEHKKFVPPNVVPSYGEIEIPIGQQRLRHMDKVPLVKPGLKVPKMTKRLDLIRGEEEVHIDFHYRQYGIIALQGGFLKSGHIEMMRRAIVNYMDTKRMFAIWRIDSPWKSHTKKSIGVRMGGGRGNISFFTSPVKAKRVLLEVGGKCCYEEVEKFLKIIVGRLPVKAMAASQEMLEQMRVEEKFLEESNRNRYTFKYIAQNGYLGCKPWIRDIDYKYWGKYN